MTDLTDKLRAANCLNAVTNAVLCHEAADRIETLEAALAELADGAERIGEAHHIVQPLLAIYRKHGETIASARAARTLGDPQ